MVKLARMGRRSRTGSPRSSVWRRYEGIDEALTHRRFARKVKQIVPVGTKGKMISLTAKNLPVERPTRSFNRLRRLALLTPSCGGLAPTAKRSARPTRTRCPPIEATQQE